MIDNMSILWYNTFYVYKIRIFYAFNDMIFTLYLVDFCNTVLYIKLLMKNFTIVTIILLFSINTFILPSEVIAEDLNYNNSSLLVIRDIQSPNTIITPKPIINPEPKVQVKKQDLSNYYNNIPEQGSCFDYIDKYSTLYGVDSDLLTRIIRAESGGNPLAKNKNSTASGCGQFIQSTWNSTLRQMGREWISPFNAEANVDAMAWKIAHGGIGAWNASKYKWAK